MLDLIFVEDINNRTLQIILINIVIGVGAMCALRYLQGLLSGVNTTEELSHRDNFAFGIALAGAALSLALILSSAVAGEEADNLLNESLNILSYAIFGIILLKVGGIINDKVIFHHFSIKEQILKHNMAAGIVLAANVIALGIIIQSAIYWVDIEDWRGLLPVFVLFIGSQFLLLLVTRLRTLIFSQRNAGEQLQYALEQGNIALAVRYLGHLIGAALAISVAGGLSYHIKELLLQSVISWFIVAVIMIMTLSVLANIARRIILHKIDVVEEVDRQHNIGVAFIEASLFIAIGLILKGLLLS